MKYCEDFAALLDPYIDGELSPEETARVREHLRSCDGCRAYVQAALTMRDAFPEAEDTEVPEGFAEGVMAAIRADAAPRKRRRPRWQKTLLPLAACCAVVILAVSGLPRTGDNAVSTADPAQQAERQLSPDTADPSDDAASLAETPETAPSSTGEDPAVAAAIVPEADTSSSDAQERDAPVATFKSGSAAERDAVAGGGAVSEAEPAPYAVQSASPLTLTADEAGTLLDAYTPTSEENGARIYTLTAAEYAALLDGLARQDLTVAGAATVQEAEAAGTVQVRVIPS